MPERLSVPHFYAACLCRMSMPHVYAACPYAYNDSYRFSAMVRRASSNRDDSANLGRPAAHPPFMANTSGLYGMGL